MILVLDQAITFCKCSVLYEGVIIATFCRYEVQKILSFLKRRRKLRYKNFQETGVLFPNFYRLVTLK